MYIRKNCSAAGCQILSLPSIDFCINHHPGGDQLNSQMTERLKSTTLLREFFFPGIRLEGETLTSRQFLHSDFSFGSFKNCVFDKSVFQFTVLNNSSFFHCSFKHIRAMESIFACCHFDGCDFQGSDLIQNNFNGSDIQHTRFNSSDLMYSRFINARISDTNFVDCNLKAVMFPATILNEASFKYSNKEEAIFGYTG